ncbi:heterokaryon incompatibility protein-domain-containing protein, partial [Bisporella sp. PMI_857]
YIALSYVWGGRQMLRTTMENFSTLMRPGALAERQEQIPRVIRDAMAVVLLMDEKFLWVDTLCIVQDDPQLKHCEIARMNTIYSQASLTIIALSATHADQGLFGIPPKFRFPATICYQGVTIMRAAPQLDDLISGSVYETRGWTLQEKVLSRRCLFFTDHLVYFRCNAGIHRETEDEPIVKLNGSVSARRANSVNPLTNLKSSIEALAWKHNFHHYKFLVRDYSKRSLSYPSDILFAFSGIQAHITAITGSDFVCGLPEAVIDAALLWYSLNNSTSERRVSSIYTLDSSLIQPPSWSW